MSFIIIREQETVLLSQRNLHKNWETLRSYQLKTAQKMFLPSRSERIGFVYPTYMMSLPIGFELFVNRIEINPNAYLFAITINGGNTGNGIRDLNTLLQERGDQLPMENQLKASLVISRCIPGEEIKRNYFR